MDGVTRDSALTIAKDLGYKVEERRISIDEVIEAHGNGTLEDAFGTGTAVTITHIKTIGFNGIFRDVRVKIQTFMCCAVVFWPKRKTTRFRYSF